MKILRPTTEAILMAVAALRDGQLIGFPTETVYGIAAVATHREAVLSTFALKGRPAENPLIVHISGLPDAEALTTRIPDHARRLAAAFWPGPLTLVLKKSAVVPDEATGGLDTVALRVPRHPVALAILQAVGAPLTAPSANSFMGLSPTRARNIAPEILAGLVCVIDGGPCDVGVESTVVDCTGREVAILRPGGISRTLIEYYAGPIREPVPDGRRSPGQYPRHYAPKTQISFVKSLGPDEAGIGFNKPANTRQIQLDMDPDSYARDLYASLYTLDAFGLSELRIESPPQDPDWEAVWDRLRRASGATP